MNLKNRYFSNLKPFQRVELSLIILLAFVIPFSWKISLYIQAALFVTTILKVVFEQKHIANPIQKKHKWIYITIISVWLIHLIGMIHTHEHAEGWKQLGQKMSFVLYPIIFFISDMSYITRRHLHTICYGLVCGVLLFFVINVTDALYDVLANNVASYRLYDKYLMEIIYQHHSYIAMYANLAIAFCFIECVTNKQRKIQILNTILLVLLSVFVILLSSRAGLICMILLFFFLWLWLFVLLKQHKKGMIMGITAILFITISFFIFPNTTARFENIPSSISTKTYQDQRIVQYRAINKIVPQCWLFGFGTGDYRLHIAQAYQQRQTTIINRIEPLNGIYDNDFFIQRQLFINSIVNYRLSSKSNYKVSPKMIEFIKTNAASYNCDFYSVRDNIQELLYIHYAIDNNTNAHNQYLETLLAVGIIGVALLLACGIVPLVVLYKNKCFNTLFAALLFIVGFNNIFESMLEKQSGIIFMLLFYLLLFNFSINVGSKTTLEPQPSTTFRLLYVDMIVNFGRRPKNTKHTKAQNHKYSSLQP